MATKEHLFNAYLAEALNGSLGPWRKHEFIAEEAYKGTAFTPDILLKIQGARRVLLECAYGGDGGRDVRSKLENAELDLEIGVAVNVPNRFREKRRDEAMEDLAGCGDLKYAVYQREEDGALTRFPAEGEIKGSARSLALFAAGAAVPSASVDRVANAVVMRIKDAAEVLEARLPDLDIAGIVDRVSLQRPRAGLQTVAVLWLDAMLVQSHLHKAHPEAVKPLDLDTPVIDLIEQWERIFDKNWHSIFEIALEVLDKTSSRDAGAAQAAVECLIKAANLIEGANLGEHINVGGELFPRVAEDRKQAAAFYTKPATAELLAALLIGNDDLDPPDRWGDPGIFGALRVADLACGTGALLRAAYRRVCALSEEHGNRDRDGIARLHADAMEKGLTGADVNPIAAHLTNSSLALMGLGEPYEETNIGWVGVGRPAANGRGLLTTGSLEFFAGPELKDFFSPPGGAMGGSGGGGRSIRAEDRGFDYIIMNPPYSRTRGKQSAFDIAGLGEDERRACQERWGELIKDRPATKTAGMAASFLCLARDKIKPGGRIGFVLPLTAAFAESWERTREMVVRDFEDIVAIAPAGGGGGEDAMSADTGMGEMLLVARRKSSGENTKPSPVLCATLRENTEHYGRAWEIAESVRDAADRARRGPAEWRPILAGKQELGVALPFQPAGGEPWSHLGVLRSEVAIRAWSIAERGVLLPMEDGRSRQRFPMTTIGRLFQVGPTHHLIGHLEGGEQIGAFTWHPINDPADIPGKDRSLWEAKSAAQKSLLVDPTHKGALFDREKAERIESGIGTAHYSRSLRWTSQALAAAVTRRRAHGGRTWTALVHEDERMGKAFALWANSTLGLLTHWTRGGRTQRGRAPVQVEAVKSMPCLDLGKLDRNRLDRAARAFDELSGLELKPACQAHADGNRALIDDACAEMLGFDAHARRAVEELRRLWCAEPSVHGNNRTAAALLRKHGLM